MPSLTRAAIYSGGTFNAILSLAGGTSRLNNFPVPCTVSFWDNIRRIPRPLESVFVRAVVFLLFFLSLTKVRFWVNSWHASHSVDGGAPVPSPSPPSRSMCLGPKSATPSTVARPDSSSYSQFQASFPPKAGGRGRGSKGCSQGCNDVYLVVTDILYVGR